jgi:hypothetical protein
MINKIVKKLGESSLLNVEIQTTATEILSMQTKSVAGLLFDLLKREPNERVTSNVLGLFRELAIRSPAWSIILQKSINKKGRCPKQVLPIIKEMLSTERDKLAGTVPSLREILSDFDVEEGSGIAQIQKSTIKEKGYGFLSSKRRVTIPFQTDLSDIEHMEELADILHNIKSPPDELILDFQNVDHLYIIGLVAFLAWCKKNNISPQSINTTDSTQKYLDIIGFSKTSSGGISPYSEADPHFQLAIESLSYETKPEEVAKKIVDVLDSHISFGKQVRAGLIVVFAEMIENTQRHAGNSYVSYACAQVYPKRNKLTFCLVDTGIGILESFRISSNENIIQRINDGESAVRLACAPLVTSKPDKHTGYGLYVASELVARNGGTFRIFSGNEIFTLYQKNWRRKEHITKLDNGWPGTWLAMIFNLDSQISIDDVYLTLPPSQGTELEEFF